MYTKIEINSTTGLVNRQVRFGSLATCIDAACNGHVVSSNRPAWLGHSARSETNGKVEVATPICLT